MLVASPPLIWNSSAISFSFSLSLGAIHDSLSYRLDDNVQVTLPRLKEMTWNMANPEAEATDPVAVINLKVLLIISALLSYAQF